MDHRPTFTALLVVLLSTAPSTHAAPPPLQVAGSVNFLGPPGAANILEALGKTAATGTANGNAYDASVSANLISGIPAIETTSSGYFMTQLQLLYAFQVNGPAAESVPIIVNGKVEALAGCTTSTECAVLSVAEAQVNAGPTYDPAMPKIRACSGSGVDCGAGFQSFTGSFSYGVAANTTQWITMTVDTYAGLPTPPSMWRAFADPTIAIDPTFPNAAAYSLEFSPGIAQAVPEAPTLSSMILGLLAAFASARRRTEA